MNATTTSNDPHAVSASCGVLVLTNDEDDPGMAAGRAAAAEIAARCGVPLTLYDRSQETWGDTQHPEGPLSLDSPGLEEAPHLRSQLRALKDSFDVLGQAWIATLPSITSLGTALPGIDADVVVVPAAMSRKLFESALPANSLVELVRNYLDGEEHLTASVVEVSDDGTIASVTS